MKITEDQITALYKFTRQHFVYHYDLQTELVDHMANDIEAIWEESPKLSFEQARDKSFKKFGIFGFMDFVESKQKQMNRRYWKILWGFVKEWFTIPKIILTLAITFLIYELLKIPTTDYMIISFFIVAILIEMIATYKIRRKHKQNETTGEKIFLLEAMIGSTKSGFTGMVFINLFNFYNLTRFQVAELEWHWIALLAFVCTLLMITFYISQFVIPKKSQELLEETYPEYKLLKNL